MVGQAFSVPDFCAQAARGQVDLRGRIAQLEHELARYRLFEDSVQDYAFIELDLENCVVNWSRGAERLTGFSEQEMLGQSAAILFTPEDRAAGAVEQELTTAMRDGCAEDERWHMRKDGSRFWGSGVMTVLENRTGFAKVMRDLTRRRLAEEALRQSEENYRLFVENVRDHALLRVDTNGRISSWNAGAERLFGYTDSEILDHPFALLYGSDDSPDHDLQGEHQSWLVRKDGSRFLARWATHAIHDEQGHLRGFAKVLRDETQRMRAESERARQELRALAANLMTVQENERRRIARNLHDDLLQRLAALEMSMAHMQQKTTPDPSLLGGLLTQWIGEVSVLSRDLSSLSHRLHPAVLDDLGLEAALRQLIEDCERTSGLSARLSARTLTEPLPHEVAMALYRIAQEALRNIASSTKEALVTVTLTESPVEVRLSVRDSEPDYDPASLNAEGGLSLVSMRERASLAGGSIEICARPGEGMEVIVAIPCWWRKDGKTSSQNG